MIPINFNLKVSLANNITKSHEVQVISLLTLHHKCTRVYTQFLMLHIDGNITFEIPQGRGRSIIEFAGSSSHVCLPTVLCVEGDDCQTRKWHLLIFPLNDYLHWKVDHVWVQCDMDQKGFGTSHPRIKKDLEPLIFFKHTSVQNLAVVVEGTQSSSDPSGLFSSSAGAGGSSTSARVEFKVCGESWAKLKIQQYIGAHILVENWK